MRTTDEHSPEVIDAIFRTRHIGYATCAVAILNNQAQGLVLRGSGTLVRVHTRSFLITASHVVVRGEYDLAPLELYVVGQSFTATRLIGEALLSHREGQVDDDLVDVAVIELAAPTVAALGDCTYLRQTDIVADDDLADDYYFFTGFPAAWAHPTGEPDAGLGLLTYCTQPYHGSTTSFRGYRSDWHFLLKRGGALHLSGEPAEMPDKLNGISGCAIWRSYFVDGDQEGQARVVAVQTGVFRSDHSVIKATRWSLVVKMIVDCHPDLLPALSIALPRRRA